MELGNHVWRYAIRRGDDDPARAAFVEQAEARLRAESAGLRRREAARRGREALLAKLRQQGVDIGRYFAELAAKGNAARWRKQSAAAAAAEAAARVKECAPGPPAGEAAARITQAEAAPAAAVAEAGPSALVTECPRGARGPQAAEAAESTPRRTGTLPVYLL
jgi:hypothetical protein